MTIIATIW
jgi:antitoxin ParD1/3/4